MSAAVFAELESFFSPDMRRHSFRFVSAEQQAAAALPLYVLPAGALPPLDMPQTAQNWLNAQNFTGANGAFTLLPGSEGQICGAYLGLGAPAPIEEDTDFFSDAATPERSPFRLGNLAALLPAGAWRFAASSLPHVPELFLACLGMILGSYRFQLKQPSAESASPQIEFALPAALDKAALEAQAEAIFFTRNLINLPANIMGCAALEQAARSLAGRFGATVKVITGEELLAANLPLIHAVGRAGSEAPRLVELEWDNRRGAKQSGPTIALVGKGVCFDTGGLDIKSAGGMALMKKDMGGAANILGLAQMIMAAKLPLRLRVFLPIVENSISGNAFRPGDILPSRKGLSVEIGNTDAEGRLILADALTLADEDAPDILLDMATLTGAARAALGPDVPPFYCRSRSFTEDLRRHAAAAYDPLWPMPLWQPYLHSLSSSAADINNAGKDGFAGSVSAALFLSRFVERAKIWAHCDIYGWRPSAAPAFPQGGDAQGARALFSLLKEKFA